MSSHIEINLQELQEFFDKIKQASKEGFQAELEKMLEGVGWEFLRILTDELIKRHKNTGDGLLISSFTKNDKNNIWSLEDNGLTLEVGTNVQYASYVNDGHRTFDPSKTKHFTLPNGELARFIPGTWNGKRFTYDPSSDRGMVLKFHWVEGIHFWESSMKAIQKILDKALEKKLQEWLDRYFNSG